MPAAKVLEPGRLQRVFAVRVGTVASFRARVLAARFAPSSCVQNNGLYLAPRPSERLSLVVYTGEVVRTLRTLTRLHREFERLGERAVSLKNAQKPEP